MFGISNVLAAPSPSPLFLNLVDPTLYTARVLHVRASDIISLLTMIQCVFQWKRRTLAD